MRKSNIYYRKASSFFIIISMVALLLSACAPIYIPNQVNVPLLNKSGNLNFSGAVATSGAEVQLAYSPFTNVGLMANGSFMWGDEDHKHQFVELGGGYYKPLGTSGVFEVYSGVGYGHSETDDIDGFGNPIGGDYLRVFVQPSLGADLGFFEGAMSVRTCYVNFPDYGSEIFFEPALTARAGFDKVKFTSQFGISVDLSGKNNFDYIPWIINFGVIFEIR
ncbi:MAG: hypothetical protein JXA68_01445 [Ignavibacteriales bacterium]|nr:hypothetical protein [Ignavibacteriales bacterium]